MSIFIMLAEGDGEISFRTWVVLGFVALSVLGGLFKKKEQPGSESKTRPEPPVKRTPHAPTPPHPPRAAPPALADLSRPPQAAAPPAPVPTPQPIPRARPSVEPRVARPATPPVGRLVTPERRRRQVRPAPASKKVGALEQHELVHLKEAQPRPKHAVRRPRSRASQLNRVLRSRNGLRAAVLLSEILAPPLALRDNQEF